MLVKDSSLRSHLSHVSSDKKSGGTSEHQTLVLGDSGVSEEEATISWKICKNVVESSDSVLLEKESHRKTLSKGIMSPFCMPILANNPSLW